MDRSVREKPFSYLQSPPDEIVKDLSENRDPVLITHDDEAKLIVMDARSYDEQQETIALLKVLAMGQVGIEQGKYRDANEVFAEFDKADET